MRWRLRLSEFDFEVRYKKGKVNSQADALSRLATLGETVVPVDEEIPCFTADAGVVLYGPDVPMAVDQLAEAFALQDYNPSGESVSPISQEGLLREETGDQLRSAIPQRLNVWEEIPFAFDEEGILIRLVNESPKIVIPKAFQVRVHHLSHYPKMAGHSGGRKMSYSLRRDFYWPSTTLDATRHQGTVQVAQKNASNSEEI